MQANKHDFIKNADFYEPCIACAMKTHEVEEEERIHLKKITSKGRG